MAPNSGPHVLPSDLDSGQGSPNTSTSSGQLHAAPSNVNTGQGQRSTSYTHSTNTIPANPGHSAASSYVNTRRRQRPSSHTRISNIMPPNPGGRGVIDSNRDQGQSDVSTSNVGTRPSTPTFPGTGDPNTHSKRAKLAAKDRPHKKNKQDIAVDSDSDITNFVDSDNADSVVVPFSARDFLLARGFRLSRDSLSQHEIVALRRILDDLESGVRQSRSGPCGSGLSGNGSSNSGLSGASDTTIAPQPALVTEEKHGSRHQYNPLQKSSGIHSNDDPPWSPRELIEDCSDAQENSSLSACSQINAGARTSSTNAAPHSELSIPPQTGPRGDYMLRCFTHAALCNVALPVRPTRRTVPRDNPLARGLGLNLQPTSSFSPHTYRLVHLASKPREGGFSQGDNGELLSSDEGETAVFPPVNDIQPNPSASISIVQSVWPRGSTSNSAIAHISKMLENPRKRVQPESDTPPRASKSVGFILSPSISRPNEPESSQSIENVQSTGLSTTVGLAVAAPDQLLPQAPQKQQLQIAQILHNLKMLNPTSQRPSTTGLNTVWTSTPIGSALQVATSDMSPDFEIWVAPEKLQDLTHDNWRHVFQWHPVITEIEGRREDIRAIGIIDNHVPCAVHSSSPTSQLEQLEADRACRGHQSSMTMVPSAEDMFRLSFSSKEAYERYLREYGDPLTEYDPEHERATKCFQLAAKVLSARKAMSPDAFGEAFGEAFGKALGEENIGNVDLDLAWDANSFVVKRSIKQLGHFLYDNMPPISPHPSLKKVRYSYDERASDNEKLINKLAGRYLKEIDEMLSIPHLRLALLIITCQESMLPEKFTEAYGKWITKLDAKLLNLSSKPKVTLKGRIKELGRALYVLCPMVMVDGSEPRKENDDRSDLLPYPFIGHLVRDYVDRDIDDSDELDASKEVERLVREYNELAKGPLHQRTGFSLGGRLFDPSCFYSPEELGTFWQPFCKVRDGACNYQLDTSSAAPKKSKKPQEPVILSSDNNDDDNILQNASNESGISTVPHDTYPPVTSRVVDIDEDPSVVATRQVISEHRDSGDSFDVNEDGDDESSSDELLSKKRNKVLPQRSQTVYHVTGTKTVPLKAPKGLVSTIEDDADDTPLSNDGMLYRRVSQELFESAPPEEEDVGPRYTAAEKGKQRAKSTPPESPIVSNYYTRGGYIDADGFQMPPAGHNFWRTTDIGSHETSQEQGPSQEYETLMSLDERLSSRLALKLRHSNTSIINEDIDPDAPTAIQIATRVPRVVVNRDTFDSQENERIKVSQTVNLRQEPRSGDTTLASRVTQKAGLRPPMLGNADFDTADASDWDEDNFRDDDPLPWEVADSSSEEDTNDAIPPTPEIVSKGRLRSPSPENANFSDSNSFDSNVPVETPKKSKKAVKNQRLSNRSRNSSLMSSSTNSTEEIIYVEHPCDTNLPGNIESDSDSDPDENKPMIQLVMEGKLFDPRISREPVQAEVDDGKPAVNFSAVEAPGLSIPPVEDTISSQTSEKYVPSNAGEDTTFISASLIRDINEFPDSPRVPVSSKSVKAVADQSLSFEQSPQSPMGLAGEILNLTTTKAPEVAQELASKVPVTTCSSQSHHAEVIVQSAAANSPVTAARAAEIAEESDSPPLEVTTATDTELVELSESPEVVQTISKSIPDLLVNSSSPAELTQTAPSSSTNVISKSSGSAVSKNPLSFKWKMVNQYTTPQSFYERRKLHPLPDALDFSGGLSKEEISFIIRKDSYVKIARAHQPPGQDHETIELRERKVCQSSLMIDSFIYFKKIRVFKDPNNLIVGDPEVKPYQTYCNHPKMKWVFWENALDMGAEQEDESAILVKGWDSGEAWNGLTPWKLYILGQPLGQFSKKTKCQALGVALFLRARNNYISALMQQPEISVNAQEDAIWDATLNSQLRPIAEKLYPKLRI